MSQVVATSVPTQSEAGLHKNTTKKHIRGSSLLLAGRIISLVLNLAVQVATVRYLSKSNYGAFAYGLTVVTTAASVVLLGLDEAIARFVPIYQEQREYKKIFGTIVVAIGTIIASGILLTLGVWALRNTYAHALINDPLAEALLMILILLAPIQALESIFEGMLAIFAHPRAIFFRRYLLGPVLKLAAVLLVVVLHSNVYFLAVSYLAGSLLGIAIYVVMTVQVLHKEGLASHFSLRTMIIPWREVFSFCIPLLSTDVVFVLRNSLVVMFLEYFHNTVEVAEFRAVFPIARLNLFVLQSFGFLFIPMAARLYAKNNREAINDLYWQTAMWITVMSFPIFAITFSLAEPLTVLLFGAQYANSGMVLAVLSLGHYFNAALGFNSNTLRVYGRVRYIVAIDFVAAFIGLALSLLLIPRFGAMGAAISTSGLLIVHNLLNHAGLLFGDTGIKLFQWRYLQVYVTVVVSSLLLLLVQWWFSLSPYFGFALAVIISLFLIYYNRRIFEIEEIFPELLRIPLMRTFLGGAKRADESSS